MEHMLVNYNEFVSNVSDNEFISNLDELPKGGMQDLCLVLCLAMCLLMAWNLYFIGHVKAQKWPYISLHIRT